MIVDLFCGARGWEALTDIEATGYEIDADACATSTAAKYTVIQADVTRCHPIECEGLLASPPCQGYSSAGLRKGRTDPRSVLVGQIARWAKEGSPRWVAAEQVEQAQSAFLAQAALLAQMGFKVWVGIVRTEQYGVPQTRKRCILLAHRDRRPQMPPPTHSRYYPRTPHRLDRGVLPWVSMAEALDLAGDPLVGFARKSDGRPGDGEYRSRDLRPSSLPAATVTEKARSWSASDPVVRSTNARPGSAARHQSRPAPTMAFGHAAPTWTALRPSPTIVGSFRPDIVAKPDFRTTTSRQDQDGSVAITPRQAGILQGFPADYPWRGSRTSIFTQIGNAIPPPLGKVIIESLMER